MIYIKLYSFNENKFKMNRSNNKRINIGIQILRMISCFGVITTHCYNLNWNKRLQYYLYVNPLHVPNFMFISFYFYYNDSLSYMVFFIWFN